MRSNIVNGILLPPTSRARGEERLRLLQAEVARIEGQLADPLRALRPAYDAWKEAAAYALDKLREEVPLLEAWLAGQPVVSFEEECEAFWKEDLTPTRA